VHDVSLFLVATLLLVLTPGADIVFVLSRGIGQGRAVALASVAGICAGYAVHTLLAAAGVSALVAGSEVAFGVLRWAGAAYLLVLGLRLLVARDPFLPDGAPALPRRAVVRQGMATSLLNPKGLLLYLAFLPQFVDPGAGGVWLAIAILGLAHVAMCALVYAAVALAAGTVGDRLRRRRSLAVALQWVTGGVLVALGARLALTDRG
jgi:threonine/homoserine/homoserine lactone efflux protein